MTWNLTSSQADRIRYDEGSRMQGEESARVLSTKDLMQADAEHGAMRSLKRSQSKRLQGGAGGGISQ